MATTPNSAIRPQTARRATAVLTAANATLSGGSAAITGAVKLCDVGANGMSWLVGLAAVPRANVAALNIQLFWSPDGGTTLNYITSYAVPITNGAPYKETDFGLSETFFRTLAPAGASFWVASDTALTAGILVHAVLEDA